MAQTVGPETLFYSSALYDDIQGIKLNSAFSSLFGRSETGAVTERVNNALELSMDIVRSRGSVKQLTERDFAPSGDNIGQNLKALTGTQFENVTYPFPLIEGKAAVNRDGILKFRQPGELGVTSSAGTDDGIITSAGMKLLKLISQEARSIFQRVEIMASESIRTGKVFFDNGIEAYDFGRAATNTDTPGTVWTDAAGVPLTDLTNHREIIDQNGKCNAEMDLMGPEAWTAFINNDQVTGSADIRNIQFIQAGDPAFKTLPTPGWVSEMESRGFDYMAYFKDFRGKKHYIFVYSDTYQDDTATWQNIMPPKDVLIFDPMIRLDRFFGPRLDWGIVTPSQRFALAQFGMSNLNGENMIQELPNGTFESWMLHHKSSFSDTTISDYMYTSPIYACTAVDMAGTLEDVVA